MKFWGVESVAQPFGRQKKVTPHQSKAVVWGTHWLLRDYNVVFHLSWDHPNTQLRAVLWETSFVEGKQERAEIKFSPGGTGIPNEKFLNSFSVNNCSSSSLGLNYFRN